MLVNTKKLKSVKALITIYILGLSSNSFVIINLLNEFWVMFVYKINHVVQQNGAYDVIIWKKSTTIISKKKLLIHIVRLSFIKLSFLE
jgi:hypothetical protein